MFVDQNALKEFLILARVASRAELETLEREAGAHGLSLAERILVAGLIPGDDLRRLEARAAGVPFVAEINDRVPYTVLAKIPEPLARAHNTIAIRDTTEGLEVIGLDLADMMKANEALAGAERFLPRLSTERLVRQLLLSYQNEQRQNFGASLHTLGASLKGEKSDGEPGALLSLLFGEAEAARARRIELFVTPAETLVRYRLGSRLYDALATNPHIGERLYEAANFPALFLDRPYTPAHRFATDISKRVIFSRREPRSVVPSLAELGLWGPNLDRLEDFSRSAGLIFFSAPELASLKELFYTLATAAVSDGRAPLMIETKRERYLNHVEQVLVTPAGGLDAASLLRRLLPQDFDTIFIEEADSPAVVALAAAAAARGQTVAVGIKAANLAGLIEAALKLIGDSYILSAVGRAFVWAEPVRSLGVEAKPARLVAEELKDLSGFVDLAKIRTALGLATADAAGDPLLSMNYLTRRPNAVAFPLRQKPAYVFEILPLDLVTAALVRDETAAKTIIKSAHERGALSLGEDAFVQAALGRIDLNEAIALIRRR